MVQQIKFMATFWTSTIVAFLFLSFFEIQLRSMGGHMGNQWHFTHFLGFFLVIKAIDEVAKLEDKSKNASNGSVLKMVSYLVSTAIIMFLSGLW